MLLDAVEMYNVGLDLTLSLAGAIDISFVKTEEKSAFGGPGIATDQSSLDQYDDNSLICLGHHGQMLPISG